MGDTSTIKDIISEVDTDNVSSFAKQSVFPCHITISFHDSDSYFWGITGWED
jgi:hypothetical protein